MGLLANHLKMAYCDFIADRVRKALVNDQWTMQDGENLIDDIGNVQMDLHPTEWLPCKALPSQSLYMTSTAKPTLLAYRKRQY